MIINNGENEEKILIDLNFVRSPQSNLQRIKTSNENIIIIEKTEEEKESIPHVDQQPVLTIFDAPNNYDIHNYKLTV